MLTKTEKTTEKKAFFFERKLYLDRGLVSQQDKPSARQPVRTLVNRVATQHEVIAAGGVGGVGF
jgi:hypothetical protein